MTVSKQRRFGYWKQSKERRASLVFILLLTTLLFFIADWSHASDIYMQVHGKGQPNNTVSYQQQAAFQPTNTMQRTMSGFSMGQMTQLQKESFASQIKTQIEAIPRMSGSVQPDLIHPKGEPTKLQKEAIAKWTAAEIEAIPRRSSSAQPDLIHPKGEPTKLQKEAIAKWTEAEIKAIPRRSGSAQPDLIHPKGEPTKLQKEAIAKWTAAEIEAIPRRSGRPRPDLDSTQVNKSLLLQWAQKRAKEKKAAQQQGQGGNSLAPQMLVSQRQNGPAMNSNNTKTTGGRLPRRKDSIPVQLCDTGKEEQFQIRLKSELATKVSLNKSLWLDDYCDTGRHECVQAILMRESAMEVQWNKDQEQPGRCGEEGRDRFEAFRWKAESEQTFEQPLGWIREAREKYEALRELCSGGNCPDDIRGTSVAPSISTETTDQLLYPSGSPYSDETKREIEKAKAEGTIIGAGVAVAGTALVLAAKGVAALTAAGGGAVVSNPNLANRALQSIKNAAGRFGNSIANLIGRAPNAGSILQKASSAANRAAGSIGKWVPKNKHLLSGGSQSKAKFITDNVGQARNWVQQALQSPNANFLPNPNIPGTFRVVTDMGQAVGIKGQQWIRAVVGMDGQVINAFPVHGL